MSDIVDDSMHMTTLLCFVPGAFLSILVGMSGVAGNEWVICGTFLLNGITNIFIMIAVWLTKSLLARRLATFSAVASWAGCAVVVGGSTVESAQDIGIVVLVLQSVGLIWMCGILCGGSTPYQEETQIAVIGNIPAAEPAPEPSPEAPIAIQIIMARTY